MLDYPLTLDSTGHLGTGLSKIFEIIDTPPKAIVSSVQADALTSPRLMKISHSSSKRNGITYNRHLVRLDLQETDPDHGAVTCAAYCVIESPNISTSITSDDIKNLVGQMIDCLTNTGNLDAILAGES